MSIITTKDVLANLETPPPPAKMVKNSPAAQNYTHSR